MRRTRVVPRVAIVTQTKRVASVIARNASMVLTLSKSQLTISAIFLIGAQQKHINSSNNRSSNSNSNSNSNNSNNSNSNSNSSSNSSSNKKNRNKQATMIPSLPRQKI